MNSDAPKILDLPIGIDATGDREEHDSHGVVLVPADHYWGAQTQRSLQHFAIGQDLMPIEVYRAYGILKQAAAIVNAGRMPVWKSELIQRVCAEVAAGELDTEFPLHVWQSGSGTHTNMNVNEVVANRSLQLIGAVLGSQDPIHPNDDVNMCQSSNDTFPTVMHVAAYTMTTQRTVPALHRLRDALDLKSRAWAGTVKIGRTHLQDATPITVGQEWSGYVGALADALDDLVHATEGLQELAIGGTAVGTGVNAPPGFGEQVAAQLSRLTGFAFRSATNKFTALGTLDRMVRAHAALASTAGTVFKIANDLRWLGSGPRTGLRELILPANEPGSSIMPGKVNPTHAEAMLMVCAQIMGNDTAVRFAGSQGNLELNTFRPLVIANYLQSAGILADAADGLREFLVDGTELNERQLADNIDRSVMMVTALAPAIGYDAAAAIAHHAVEADLTLRDAAMAKGVSEELFDSVVDPLAMTRPAQG
ncbi:MAG: class II fumarate hydratase [Candidatus Nanopelagicales bacterium]